MLYSQFAPFLEVLRGKSHGLSGSQVLHQQNKRLVLETQFHCFDSMLEYQRASFILLLPGVMLRGSNHCNWFHVIFLNFWDITQSISEWNTYIHFQWVITLIWVSDLTRVNLLHDWLSVQKRCVHCDIVLLFIEMSLLWI